METVLFQQISFLPGLYCSYQSLVSNWLALLHGGHGTLFIRPLYVKMSPEIVHGGFIRPAGHDGAMHL